MLNQKRFWLPSSVLGLVLAVMGSGWVFYQSTTMPGTVLSVSDFTVGNNPNSQLGIRISNQKVLDFRVSYMPADLYLSSHKYLLDEDHRGYLDMGMYANYFAVEVQYKDETPITIQDVKINNEPSCTTPSEGPPKAEIVESVQRASREAIDQLWRSVREIAIMPELVYPKPLNFGEVFYLISKCSPWRAQIDTDRGTVSYK